MDECILLTGQLKLCEHFKKQENCIFCNLNKTTERLDKIENLDHDERISDLEKISAESRLIKLEVSYRQGAHLVNYKSYIDLADRIEKLESWTKEHEKEGLEYGEDFENRDKLLQVRFDYLLEDFNVLLELLCKPDSIPGRPSKFELKETFNKKPHKCPVCEGKCKKMFDLPGGGYYEVDCKSCDGQGIVWG